MNETCINCKNPITRGMLCPGCAAVADICTHFTAYVFRPSELPQLLDDLERHGVTTADGLYALADSRSAPQMKALGAKCMESERSGGAGVFDRAMKRLARNSKDADASDLLSILRGATVATLADEPKEKPDRNGTLSIFD